MVYFIVPFITTVVAVFIKERDSIKQDNLIPKIVLPLLVIAILILAATILYNAQKGIIKRDSKFNKYKIPSNNILIKIKLFKDSNDTNWILVGPYLLIFCINFLVLLLYVIYLCGVFKLKILLESAWFGGLLCIFLPILILYYTIVRQIILDNYKQNPPDFHIDK